MTRAELYKAPKIKHFSPHHGRSHPSTYYHQQDYEDLEEEPESPTPSHNYGTSTNEYNNEEDYDDTRDGNDFDESVIDDSFGDATEPSQCGTASLEATTLTPKKESIFGANPQDIITPPHTIPRFHRTSVFSSSSTGPRKSGRQLIDFSSSFPQTKSYKESPLSSTRNTSSAPSSSPTPSHNASTRSNVFGQEIPVYKGRTNSVGNESKSLSVQSSILRTDTPTTQINKRLNLFRVQTPLFREVTTQDAEPKTPVEQTGGFQFADNYGTPVSNRKMESQIDLDINTFEESDFIGDGQVCGEEESSRNDYGKAMRGDEGAEPDKTAYSTQSARSIHTGKIKTSNSGFRVNKKSDVLSSPFKTPVRLQSSMFPRSKTPVGSSPIRRPPSTQPGHRSASPSKNRHLNN